MGKEIAWKEILDSSNHLVRLNDDVLDVLHIGNDRLTIKARLARIMRDIQYALSEAIQAAYKPGHHYYKRTGGIWQTVMPQNTQYSLSVRGRTVSAHVNFDTTHYHRSYFIKDHPKVNTLWILNDGYMWEGLEKEDYILYFNIRPEFDIIGEMNKKLMESYRTTYSYIRDYGIHIEIDFGRGVL